MVKSPYVLYTKGVKMARRRHIKLITVNASGEECGGPRLEMLLKKISAVLGLLFLC